ncbi:hypothetical protein E4U53_000061, partial [Claviceps sorghi]
PYLRMTFEGLGLAMLVERVPLETPWLRRCVWDVERFTVVAARNAESFLSVTQEARRKDQPKDTALWHWE